MPPAITRRGLLTGAAAVATYAALQKRAGAELSVTNLIGFGGGGVFPVVKATNTSQTDANSTTHAVSLPAGIVSGDLLLIGISSVSTWTTPSGWTLLYSINNTHRHNVWYRQADGGEGASVTVTGGSSVLASHFSYRISGAQASPEAATASTWDPPNLAPSWGSKKTLWLATAGQRGGSVTGTPTNYTNQVTSYQAVDDIRLVAMHRELDAASEDPSAYTLSVAASEVAATIAIQPI